MKRRKVLRVLPALAVLALLCVAAAGPKAPLMPVAPPPMFSYCPEPTLVGGGTVVDPMANAAGVSQPLPEGTTVAACSLHVVGTGWTWSQLRVREWDPLTLAPDPSTIAMRAEDFDPSRMNYYITNSVPSVQFVPPIVTRSIPGVAEPPRQTTALEIFSTPGSYSLQAFYDADGNSAMPAAGAIAADGTHGPLPGAHPVVAHAICTGDVDLDQLRVAQSVRRTDETVANGTQDIVQRFRVPQAVELRWIELAVARGPGSGPAGVTTMPVPNAVVGIVDGAVMGEPVTPMPATLVEAAFAQYFYYEPAPRWASHVDFDHTVILLPSHDYWLYLRGAGSYLLLSRVLTGGEDPEFTAGVGPMYTRSLPAYDWTSRAARALAFTIVGKPLLGVGVGAPTPARDGIRLRITPNPTRDLAEIAWSGGVGPVRLEVLDARGRRVATGEGGAAGTWQMTRGTRGNAPLPAGVYFVHARDTAGAHAVERLVIVR
jgi:hypothetical protein